MNISVPLALAFGVYVTVSGVPILSVYRTVPLDGLVAPVVVISSLLGSLSFAPMLIIVTRPPAIVAVSFLAVDAKLGLLPPGTIVIIT